MLAQFQENFLHIHTTTMSPLCIHYTYYGRLLVLIIEYCIHVYSIQKQIEKREHVLSQYIKPPPPPRIVAHHSLGYHVKKGHTWIANQTAIQQRQNVKVEEEKVST
jgi:hypothetical protein